MTERKAGRRKIVDGLCRVLSKADVSSKLSPETQANVTSLLDKGDSQWSSADVHFACTVIGEAFDSLKE
jgi:hypothetical protein